MPKSKRTDADHALATEILDANPGQRFTLDELWQRVDAHKINELASRRLYAPDLMYHPDMTLFAC